MRRFLCATALATLGSAAYGDMMGTDENGVAVILRDDGTWSYAAEAGQLLLTAEQVGLEDVDVYELTYRNWNNANWGQSGSMTVASNVGGMASTRRRVFIRFDEGLAGNPIGPQDRVYLVLNGLNLEPGQSTIGVVHRVTQSWTEGAGVYHADQVEPTSPPGTVSWINQPAIDDTKVWALADFDREDGVVQIDISDLARAWASGQQPNFGLALLGESEGPGRYQYSFTSSESPRINLRPRILIERAGVPAAPPTPVPATTTPPPPPPIQPDMIVATGKGWRVITHVADPQGWTMQGFPDVHWSAAVPAWSNAPTAPQQIGNMGDTRARWIWEASDADTAYFRRDFTLAGAPQAAQLRITADNAYTVWINGVLVGQDTANLVSVWQTAEVYDVARLLQPGANVIAVMAQDFGAQSGLLADLLVQTGP